MASLPQVVTLNLPGRILARAGLEVDVPGAALRLGEIAVTTDAQKFYVGDESQDPPWTPLRGFKGTIPWGDAKLEIRELSVTNINGKSIGEFVATTIINTGQVLTVIKEAVTKTVYGQGADFTDLQDAFAWLSQRTIADTGSVLLQLPATRIFETKAYNLGHPNGNRITIAGAELKTALPDVQNMQVQGFSSSQRIADTAANLVRLRQSYATEFSFSNGGGFRFSSNLQMFQNVLVTSDGTNAGTSSLTDGIIVNAGSVSFKNIASSGWTYRGLVINVRAALNFTSDSKNFFFGNQYDGIAIGFFSLLAFTYARIFCGSNGANGVTVGSSSSVAALPIEGSLDTRSVFYCGGNVGGAYFESSIGNLGNKASFINNDSYGIASILSNVYCVTATISGSPTGIFADRSSFVRALNATISASSIGIKSSNNSTVTATASNVTAPTPYSPALNTEGNFNATVQS